MLSTNFFITLIVGMLTYECVAPPGFTRANTDGKDSANAQDCPCYRSTTTVVNPTCEPFAGICPFIICAEATATATVTVPPNAAALDLACDADKVPTVTRFKPCTTDCAPVTCPTKTITKTAEKEKECCTAW